MRVLRNVLVVVLTAAFVSTAFFGFWAETNEMPERVPLWAKLLSFIPAVGSALLASRMLEVSERCERWVLCGFGALVPAASLFAVAPPAFIHLVLLGPFWLLAFLTGAL